MPIAGLGLHVLIAICFAVHALRSGQDRYWLFILFMFPLLGSLVYAIAIWLPELRGNPGARRVASGLRHALDPQRELREARDAFELSPSADHRLRLAEALLAAGRADEAVEQFRAAMSKVHSDDPAIQVRLAQALLDAGDAAATIAELDALRRAHPGYRSSEGHLLYARALAADGQRERAREEFDSVVGYFAGFEARARYAETLLRWGEQDAARALAVLAAKQAARLPKYSQRMNREWIARLQRVERGEALDAR